MTDHEYTTFQDDGCPNCPAHLPQFTDTIGFWVGNHIIRVKVGKTILAEVRSRPWVFSALEADQ